MNLEEMITNLIKRDYVVTFDERAIGKNQMIFTASVRSCNSYVEEIEEQGEGKTPTLALRNIFDKL